MANLFFRTNITPYRIDTYNALHDKLGCEFYFLYKEESSQKFDMQSLYNQCSFLPKFLKSLPIISNRQRLCINIWSILRHENPEVVIVPEFKILTVQVLLYKWIFRKKFKVISMCDDSWDMIVNNHDFSRAHKIMRKLISPHLDNLLLVENRVVDWFKNKYGKGIWLPIIRDERKEIPKYEKAIPLSRTYMEEFGLNGKKVLLFVGRLAHEKNIEGLIDAAAKAKENFVTVIVGSGELEMSLREKANAVDKPILFVGRYEGDGIRAWYNVADIFILPSKLEPFGAVTNEALIAGCICLISENAGSVSLINNTNGNVLKPYDSDDMAKKIDEMMKKIQIRKEFTHRPNMMTMSFDETLNRVIKDIINN